ncbi:MAG: apolipoprotein N-acyltransferase [Melioribacteraceae bacterium]|nr:MAG: apolipoprotein N-acyltransferase [Melioribacteraceae bacterium]
MSDSTKFLVIEDKKQRRKDWYTLILSGVLLGASFPPSPLPFLAFLAFVPYFSVIEKRNGLGSINRATYLFALVFNIITLYWVGSWTEEADPFLKISGVVLVFFNPLLFLIPSTLYHIARKYTGRKYAIWFLPLFYAGYEYLYTITEFRFPWLVIGNGQAYFNTYIQIADIIGAHGITILVLLTNIFLYFALKQFYNGGKYLRQVVYASLIFAVPLLYGVAKGYPVKTLPGFRAGIVQPDMNPWNKWETGNLEKQLEDYLSLSDSCIADGADLVVWPETALPVYLLSGRYENIVEKIHAFVDSTGVPVLTGMPHANIYRNRESAPWDAKPIKGGDEAYTSYNSILLFEPGTNEVERYGKIMLVPYGEKVPYVESLPWLGDLLKWEVGISSWNTGRDTVVFETKINEQNINIGGVICIESIYPDFTAQFVGKGANVLAVVTNDSWYGYSSGPFQHKAISILRAIENRRYLIRCANGGVSCIISPSGEIEEETELFTRTYLTGMVYPNNELTFYSRFPLLIPGLSTVTIVFFAILGLLKKIRKILYKK